jgi:hypothetical protein
MELVKVTGRNNIPEEAEIRWIVSGESCNRCYPPSTAPPTAPALCGDLSWQTGGFASGIGLSE